MARVILTKAPLAIVIDRATIRPHSPSTIPQLQTAEPKPMPRYNLHFTINTTREGEWNEFEHTDVATDSIDTSVLTLLELYPQCSSMVIVLTFPRRAN